MNDNSIMEYAAHCAPYLERLIDECVKRGLTMSVYDGQEWTVKHSSDRDEVLDALATTDCDRLMLRKNGEKVGWFDLIYCNDGDEIFQDFTSNTICCELANHALQENLFT